jgi:hypothetical protein
MIMKFRMPVIDWTEGWHIEKYWQQAANLLILHASTPSMEYPASPSIDYRGSTNKTEREEDTDTLLIQQQQ